MIIQSGNDASIALAEFVAGTEEAFVTLMNEQARQLELSNTHYTNSTGLPDDQQHYTTVRDLAKLTKALIQNFADYYRWYSQQEFTYNDITQYNRNRLLWQDYTVDGVKTGFTDMAGYCLIASAKRGNMRLIAIVMGTKSEKNRLQDSEKMLDYGFRFFETFPLYEQMQPIDVERIWYGTADQVPLGLMETLYVTIPKGYYKQLQATIHIDKHIMAPVVAGKVYGTLNINLGNQVIAEQPLTALTSVEIGHLGKRLLDSLWLLFY
jgi:D-alanyl-D-alanine carboxypeptidase (penicillin-binding protein 5/6)